jgi:hypothetical protein
VSAKVYDRVVVQPGTRLEALYAQYDELESAAKNASARFEDLKTAIKAELSTTVSAGTTAISGDCASVGLTLELSYVESWRLDTNRFKEEHPGLYVAYAKKSGSWTLKRGKA